MKICIVSSEHSPYGGIGNALRRQVELLRSRHEVFFIERPEPSEEVGNVSFASADHRCSAAVLERIEDAYGDEGPDLLEVCDYRAPGLVPLQARRAGHPTLRQTTVAVRLSSTAELLSLHNGSSLLPGEQRVADLEREQFRLADRLIWPGGDILEAYRRYYGEALLPPAIRIGRAFAPAPAPEVAPRDTSQPLRLLYVGRLQRLKGVLDLVEACLRLRSDDWELTLIGADTPTAAMGQSVRLTIEAMSGSDPRVRIEDALPYEELQRRWSEHDLLVVPSAFEVCNNVALEAMRAGLPVLATPVGGQTGFIEDGVSGWLAEGTGPRAIGRAIQRLLDDRAELEQVRASGAVFAGFQRFTDPETVLARYEELLAKAAGERPAAVAGGGEEPLVSAVIPYYRAHAYVEEAVASLLAQTHRNLEVVIVDDGSFDGEDTVLEKLDGDPRVRVVHQLNRGDAAARNLGIELARGEHLMMFDADNVLEPEFVSRALAMLQADPQLAYVTCWLRFIGPEGEALDGRGYAPLGNRVLRDEGENWSGDTIALIPRRVIAQLDPPYVPDMAVHSDWTLYRRLRARGEYGAVIPELLARYRVRPDSLLRMHDEWLHHRTWEEGSDLIRLEKTQWVK
ncbi:MAG TPA: glycosyltransferase [Solirubrobacterales bacterium]|nr:glycosyltransferase [Solirubrobacterales bacterium]